MSFPMESAPLNAIEARTLQNLRFPCPASLASLTPVASLLSLRSFFSLLTRSDFLLSANAGRSQRRYMSSLRNSHSWALVFLFCCLIDAARAVTADDPYSDNANALTRQWQRSALSFFVVAARKELILFSRSKIATIAALVAASIVSVAIGVCFLTCSASLLAERLTLSRSLALAVRASTVVRRRRIGQRNSSTYQSRLIREISDV
jgi:hypothetical protein